MDQNADDILVLVKVETVEGTDAVPTGAANAIQTKNFSRTPLEANELDRNLDGPGYGSRKGALTQLSTACSFDVEGAGSGAVATPTAIAPLFLMGGLAETINALVSVQYDPVSSAEQSTSIYNWKGTNRQRMLGAKNKLSVSGKAGEYLNFGNSVISLYDTPVEIAQETPTYTQRDPLEINTTNTTFSLFGYAAILESLEIDFGQDNSPQHLVGSNKINFGGRKASGKCTIILPALATKDFINLAATGVEGVLSFIHGTVDGDIIEIQANQVELGKITEGEINGKVSLEIPFKLNVNTGDDDFRIITR